MSKICVIFTGGTIGSKVNDNKIDVSSASAFDLLDRFNNTYKGECPQFEILQPYSVLSESMRAINYKQLIKAIAQINTKDYSGIIVTHGSDTLAYTSNLLGMIFSGINIPLFLVCSNKTLGAVDCNGLANFTAAVDFISKVGLNGVFTTYLNKYGKQKIHLATRIIQATVFDGEIDSIKGLNFGQIVDGDFIYNATKGNVTKTAIRRKKNIYWIDNVKLFEDIMFIRPYPNMNYDFYKSQKVPKVILHDLYHSGTACVAGKDTSLIEFSEYCRENKIDLYLAPMCADMKDVYASSDLIMKKGVTLLRGISLESAYIKIMLAYGNFSTKKARAEFIGQDIFFEYLV